MKKPYFNSVTIVGELDYLKLFQNLADIADQRDGMKTTITKIEHKPTGRVIYEAK